jgi:hypothetical protein
VERGIVSELAGRHGANVLTGKGSGLACRHEK